jgi:hypothetical protein
VSGAQTGVSCDVSEVRRGMAEVYEIAGILSRPAMPVFLVCKRGDVLQDSRAQEHRYSGLARAKRHLLKLAKIHVPSSSALAASSAKRRSHSSTTLPKASSVPSGGSYDQYETSLGLLQSFESSPLSTG